jgi:hypothetical protein
VAVGIAASAAVAGITALGVAVVKMGQRGAVVSDVSDAFKSLAASAGSTGEVMLGALSKGVAGTLSNFELMKLANKALGAGLVGTAADFETLGAGARMLAKRVGGDTKTAFETLTSAIATGRTAQLKQMGVFVDSKAAIEKYAAELGVLPGKLNDTQRAAALSAETLSQLRKELDANAPPAADFGEMIQQARVHVENFSDNLSVAIANSPAVRAAMKAMGEAFEDAFGGDQSALIEKLIGYVNKFALFTVDAGVMVVKTARVITDAFYEIRAAMFATLEFGAKSWVTLGEQAVLYGWILRQTAKLMNPLMDSRPLDNALNSLAGFVNQMKAVGGSFEETKKDAQASRAEWSATFEAGEKTLAGLRAEMVRLIAQGVGVEEIVARLRESGEAAGMSAEEVRALAKAQDSLFGHDLIAKANAYAKQLGDVSNVSKLAADKKLELNKAMLAALDAYRRLGQTAPQVLRTIEAATRPLLVTTRQWAQVALKEAAREMTPFAASVRDLGVNAVPLLSAAIHHSRTGFVQLKEAVSDAGEEIREITASSITLGQTIEASLLGVMDNLPGTIQRAFEGGGGLVGAFKSIGVQLADAITKPILEEMSKVQQRAVGIGAAIAGSVGGAVGGSSGAAVGSSASLLAGAALKTAGVAGGAALGVATAGIGLAAVGIFKLIQHNRNLNKEVKEWNGKIEQTRKGLLEIHGSLDMLDKKAAAVGMSRFSDEWAHQGEKGAAAFAKFIKEFESRLKDLNKGFGELFTELENAGMGLPEHFIPAIDRLIEMGVLSEDLADKFRELSGAPGWEQMAKSAQALGVELGALGPAFDAKKLAADADEVLKHLTILSRGGADIGGVLAGAAPKMAALVKEALRIGTELPEGLREYVMELERAGLLVDENGDALGDLSRLNWAEPMSRSVDRLISKFEELIDRILQSGSALSNLPNLPGAGAVGGGIPFGGAQARGGDYMVNKPTMFLAGEAGPERATFTPLGKGGAAAESRHPLQIMLDGRAVAEVVLRIAGNRLSLMGAR